MASFEGVEDATLDLGIELRDVAIHSDILPVRFFKAVAGVEVAVELSHYPCSEEEIQSEQAAAPNRSEAPNLNSTSSA
jgi:hypothetical protein